MASASICDQSRHSEPSTSRRVRPLSVRATRSGITIVEVLIVVLLIGILAAVATPQFRDSQEEYRGRLAATRVARDLESVSALAIAQGRRVTIHFLNGSEKNGSRYWVTGVQHPILKKDLVDVSLQNDPYEVSLVDAPAMIVYDMYGLPDGDYEMTVARPNGKSWRILVRQNTHRVEVVDGR